MKFANQTTRRANQTPTEDSGIISPFLWLPSNLELNIQSPIVKVSDSRRVFLDLFGILHSEQLNRKSVRE